MGFFPPTDREKQGGGGGGGGQKLFLCALQWSPSLDTLTRGIQPTAFHLPQTCTCIFAHTYALKHMHKQCSSTYTGTPLKYVYSIHTNTHASTVCDKEIHHVWESPSILPLVAYVKREIEVVLSRILFIFYIIFLYITCGAQTAGLKTDNREISMDIQNKNGQRSCTGAGAISVQLFPFGNKHCSEVWESAVFCNFVYTIFAKFLM